MLRSSSYFNRTAWGGRMSIESGVRAPLIASVLNAEGIGRDNHLDGPRARARRGTAGANVVSKLRSFGAPVLMTGGPTAVDRSLVRVRPSRAHDERGLTILESLTAATILLVVAIGVMTVLITTGSWYAKARLRTQAYAVANQVMSTILSRNYSDIRFAGVGESFPTGILESMPWPSTGHTEFTVLTSMETTTDAKTGLEMKRISVSALPVVQSLEPTVTVVRFASGWQQMSTSTQKFLVTVKITLKKYADPSVDPGWQPRAGARVQLLDVDTLDEAYYAVTDDDGVATFNRVVEGQYYLTSDPRFGTDIRPVNFPMRISPTHGGSANNPIMPVNAYDLLVTKSPIEATLRVGSYITEGWTVIGTPQPPEVPYRYVPGLIIYASPVLNASSSNNSGYYGMGSAPLYPEESKLPVYSGTVNAYGVAPVSIKWLTDPVAQQYWRIWCRTRAANGVVTVHTLTTGATGGWTSGVERPDGAYGSTATYGNILQFTWLGDGVTAVNDPTMPPASAFNR
jgi:Tfp pilus assembly protein PilV